MSKSYWVSIYWDSGRVSEYELEGNSLEDIENQVLELTGGADVGEICIEEME